MGWIREVELISPLYYYTWLYDQSKFDREAVIEFYLFFLYAILVHTIDHYCSLSDLRFSFLTPPKLCVLFVIHEHWDLQFKVDTKRQTWEAFCCNFFFSLLLEIKLEIHLSHRTKIVFLSFKLGPYDQHTKMPWFFFSERLRTNVLKLIHAVLW